MIVRRLVVAVVVLALASPRSLRPASAPRALDLRLVKDRAICPIEVVLDREPSRSPARIKLLKCAEQPLARCLANNVSRAHCCAWHDGEVIGHCIEIIDYVAVQYRTATGELGAPEPYAVAVGCTCMAANTTEALAP